MISDKDIPLQDRAYATQLIQVIDVELQEVASLGSDLVSIVVLSALKSLLEDVARGDITLSGLPSLLEAGIDNEQVITPPQKQLVGTDKEKEQKRQSLHRRYLWMIQQRRLQPSYVDGVTFYQELTPGGDTETAGPCLAVFETLEALVPIYPNGNSAVEFSSVSQEYLDQRCRPVIWQRVAHIHPALLYRLWEDEDRERFFANQELDGEETAQ